MNTLGTLNDPPKKSRSRWDVDFTLCHAKVQKVNDNIASPRHGNLPGHVLIQKWDIQWAKSIINHPRVPKTILQQYKDHIWSIYTSVHRHHKHQQTDNSRGNFTVPGKCRGRTILHAIIYWETAPWVHMDWVTNKLAGNSKYRWFKNKEKTAINDLGVPNFWMHPSNTNHVPS